MTVTVNFSFALFDEYLENITKPHIPRYIDPYIVKEVDKEVRNLNPNDRCNWLHALFATGASTTGRLVSAGSAESLDVPGPHQVSQSAQFAFGQSNLLAARITRCEHLNVPTTTQYQLQNVGLGLADMATCSSLIQDHDKTLGLYPTTVTIFLDQEVVLDTEQNAMSLSVLAAVLAGWFSFMWNVWKVAFRRCTRNDEVEPRLSIMLFKLRSSCSWCSCVHQSAASPKAERYQSASPAMSAASDDPQDDPRSACLRSSKCSIVSGDELD